MIIRLIVPVKDGHVDVAIQPQHEAVQLGEAAVIRRSYLPKESEILEPVAIVDSDVEQVRTLKEVDVVGLVAQVQRTAKVFAQEVKSYLPALAAPVTQGGAVARLGQCVAVLYLVRCTVEAGNIEGAYGEFLRVQIQRVGGLDEVGRPALAAGKERQFGLLPEAKRCGGSAQKAEFIDGGVGAQRLSAPGDVGRLATLAEAKARVEHQALPEADVVIADGDGLDPLADVAQVEMGAVKIEAPFAVILREKSFPGVLLSGDPEAHPVAEFLAEADVESLGAAEVVAQAVFRPAFVANAAFEAALGADVELAVAFGEHTPEGDFIVVQTAPHLRVAGQPADALQVHTRDNLQLVDADEAVHPLPVFQELTDLDGRQQPGFFQFFAGDFVEVEGALLIGLQQGESSVEIELIAFFFGVSGDVFDELLLRLIIGARRWGFGLGEEAEREEQKEDEVARPQVRWEGHGAKIKGKPIFIRCIR